MADPPATNFFTAFGKTVTVLLLTALPLLVAEGLARLCHSPVPVRRVYDPFAFRIPQPNLVDHLALPDGEVTVRWNELGMRGSSLAEPPAAGALTVIFFGGSTTENYAYPDEATFPFQIGEQLTRELKRQVRVFNAGISAGTTSTTLGRFQHQALDLQPDLVVVMQAINDFLQGFHPDYRKDQRHLRRPAVMGTRPRSYVFCGLAAQPALGRPGALACGKP